MNKKYRNAGILFVGVLGLFLLFRGGETPDSTEKGGDSESTSDIPFQPQEPSILTPREDFGIAGAPRAGAWQSPYGAPNPYYEAYPSQDPAASQWGAQQGYAMEGYRFRPLGERERQRMASQHPGPRYQRLEQHTQTMPPSGAMDPSYYQAPGAYRDPRMEGYSFRPLGKSDRASRRWQGPYQNRAWRDGYREFADDRSAFPDYQWSRTPPARVPPSRRMYPSLDWNSHRKLSAR